MNEHTKGPWHSDGNHVRNEGGLIATAMIAVRLRDRIDETRLDGESWMAMYARTKPLREENEEIEKDLLTLIAAAPEMLEALKECFGTIKEYHEYEHDGDPWTEDARAMGEMDLDAFERDGRMEKVSNLIEKLDVQKQED